VIRAAGILFLAEDGDRVLLLRRSPSSSQPGTWCFPGGCVEGDESAEQAARREALEEIGWSDPDAELSLWTRVARDGADFTTYLCRVPAPFDVRLNEEHTEHAWVPRVEIGERFTRVDAIKLTDSDFDYRPDVLDPQPIVTIYQNGEIRVRAPK